MSLDDQLGFVGSECGADHVGLAASLPLSQAPDPLHIAIVEVEAGLLHQM
jgi:hypothetical protein